MTNRHTSPKEEMWMEQRSGDNLGEETLLESDTGGHLLLNLGMYSYAQCTVLSNGTNLENSQVK